MNINSSVAQWVVQHVQEITGRCVAVPCRLVPGVAAGKAISRRQDKLGSARAANAVDRCLVVLQQQISRLEEGIDP